MSRDEFNSFPSPSAPSRNNPSLPPSRPISTPHPHTPSQIRERKRDISTRNPGRNSRNSKARFPLALSLHLALSRSHCRLHVLSFSLSLPLSDFLELACISSAAPGPCGTPRCSRPASGSRACTPPAARTHERKNVRTHARARWPAHMPAPVRLGRRGRVMCCDSELGNRRRKAPDCARRSGGRRVRARV